MSNKLTNLLRNLSSRNKYENHTVKVLNKKDILSIYDNKNSPIANKSKVDSKYK